MGQNIPWDEIKEALRFRHEQHTRKRLRVVNAQGFRSADAEALQSVIDGITRVWQLAEDENAEEIGTVPMRGTVVRFALMDVVRDVEHHDRDKAARFMAAHRWVSENWRTR